MGSVSRWSGAVRGEFRNPFPCQPKGTEPLQYRLQTGQQGRGEGDDRLVRFLWH